MLHGAPIPFIAKLCVAAVVTTGAGVATYEIAVDSGPPGDKVEVATESAPPAPEDDALAFAEEDDEEKSKPVIRDKEPEKTAAEMNEEDKVEHVKDEDLIDDKKTEEAEEDDVKEKPLDTIAPELVILHPADGSHYDEKHVVFEGETEPGAIVKAGPYEATVDADGNWRIELILSPGANRAVLTAVDTAGNVSDASVVVHLDVEEAKPVEKDKHDEEPKVVEFSANQKWGFCEEEVPYDVFWGTATPNTVVHIVSAYGNAEVEVGKHGHWEKKVYFETAPRGQAFLVVVEAVNGRTEFEFVANELNEEHEGEHSE